MSLLQFPFFAPAPFGGAVESVPGVCHIQFRDTP